MLRLRGCGVPPRVHDVLSLRPLAVSSRESSSAVYETSGLTLRLEAHPRIIDARFLRKIVVRIDMMLGHEQPFPAARLVRRTGRTGHSIAWGQHTEETEYNLTDGKNAVTDYSYNGNPGCTAGDPPSAACRNTGGSGGGCPDYDPGCPGFTGGGAGPSGEKIGGYTGPSTPSPVTTTSPQPVELQAIYLTALTRMWETPQAAPVYA